MGGTFSLLKEMSLFAYSLYSQKCKILENNGLLCMYVPAKSALPQKPSFFFRNSWGKKSFYMMYLWPFIKRVIMLCVAVQVRSQLHTFLNYLCILSLLLDLKCLGTLDFSGYLLLPVSINWFCHYFYYPFVLKPRISSFSLFLFTYTYDKDLHQATGVN